MTEYKFDSTDEQYKLFCFSKGSKISYAFDGDGCNEQKVCIDKTSLIQNMACSVHDPPPLPYLMTNISAHN